MLKHLVFSLNIFATYFFCIFFAIITYQDSGYDISFAAIFTEEFLKVFIETIIPTTAVYATLSILFSFDDTRRDEEGYKRQNGINAFALIFVFGYTMLYCIYIRASFSIAWFIIELTCTVIVILLCVVCYRESYIQAKQSSRPRSLSGDKDYI